MNMPGFTAEESIYRINNVYNRFLTSKNTRSLIDISPVAVIKGLWSDCMQECSDFFVECIGSAENSFDVCQCRNEFTTCMDVRCLGRPAHLERCFPVRR